MKTLDLIFLSPNILRKYNNFWVGEDLGSDHSVTVCVLAYTPLQDTTPDRTINLYHKADWTDINRTISNKMDLLEFDTNTVTPQDIDTYVDTLTNTITNTIKDKVPTKTLSNNAVGLSREVRELIILKRRQRRYWQQTRQQHYKANYNRLNKQIKHIIQQEKRDRWEGYCNDLELREGQDDQWRKLKGLLNPRKKSEYPTLITKDARGNTIKAYTTEDKLESFASSLEQTFTREGDTTNYNDATKHSIDNEIHQHVHLFTPLNHINHDITQHDDSIAMTELLDHITQLNIKKACGHDKISNRIITNLLPSLLLILLSLYNACLFLGYYPTTWKRAWSLMIHKPNKKKSDPGNFRPISLLCNLGKLLEAIITSRMRLWAEGNHILSPEQSGFRQHKSTNDKLFQLTQIISQNFARRKCRTVGTLFLDVAKAFDRIWHNGLRHRLLKLRLPTLLLRWVSNFLTGRIMQAYINGETSREVIINHGVPQGSPLSPILFIIFTSNLPNTRPQVFRSQYADDIKLYVPGRKIDLVRTRLQASIDDLSQYCSYWRMALCSSKTVLMLFSKSSRPWQGACELQLQGKVVDTATSSKFLGITFDQRLTFNTHFQNIACTARQRITKLISISNSRHGPSAHTLIRLYKTYVRTLFEYGSAATCVASPSVFGIWEKLQTRLITHALDLPNYIRHDNLRRYADLPTVQDRVLYTGKRWYRNTMLHNEPMRDFIQHHTTYYPDFDKPIRTPYLQLRN